METPRPPTAPADDFLDPGLEPAPVPRGGIWTAGGWLTWVAGLVLMLSPLMGWYVGSNEGPTIAVIGWHTGVLGKLVLVLGAAVLALSALREFGIELPATLPESLVVIVLGAIATIFILIRLISIPEEFVPNDGRGVGIFVALVAAIGVIVGGLLRASEEL
ncbi:MAG: hypothetical protein ICV59_00730 [Thermoleophilia bacterium]|nr:hypothetical protein [Thermoleophilia bacterium]